MQYSDEDGPPPNLLFGGDEDEDEDDATDAAAASPPGAKDQIGIERVDESNLRSVMQRIGQDLPRVCVGDTTGAAQPIYQSSATAAEAIAVAELHYRTELIQRHMGSLALCRGSRGDALHEAGAVDAALSVLAGLSRDYFDGENCASCKCKCSDAIGNTAVRLPVVSSIDKAGRQNDGKESPHHQSIWSEVDQATVALASACLGAIRDLACGNASNRAAVSEYVHPVTLCCDKCSSCACSNQNQNGSQILASYVRRYHEMKWEEIISLAVDDSLCNTDCTSRGRKELRLFTDATGAIRNASHSTPKTCADLHAANVTEMFIWRLKHGSKEYYEECSCDVDNNTKRLRLPDASLPWREASFRIAGSLINISEKCPDSSRRCGSDLALVYLLVEAWGGAGTNFPKKRTSASTPLLHLGLAAIVHSADGHLLHIGQGGLDPVLRTILDKEEARKRFAQKKEAERQDRIARGLKLLNYRLP